MFFLSPILLGLAVSLDGMGAGFAYGMRKVHIPPVSLLIICLSSSFSIFLSMTAGSFAAAFFPAGTATLVGSITLTGVGLLILVKALAEPKNDEKDSVADTGKGISLIQAVMREPSKADMDSSGAISGKEAVVLGVALAADAFGAGFGAALMGFSPLVTSLAVGIGKYFFLLLGSLLGRKFAKMLPEGGAAALAGVILVLLGLFSFWH